MAARTPVDGSLCQECSAPATQYLELGTVSNGGKPIFIATFCGDACETLYWQRCKRIRSKLPEEEEDSEYELVDTSIINIEPGVNLNCHGYRREEIGRCGWVIQHSFAAVYPEEPSEDQIDSMGLFIEHFARNYACLICRPHWMDLVKRFPPDLTSRATLKLWVCTMHNRVNTSLGKAQYNCECAEKLLASYKCRES